MSLIQRFLSWLGFEQVLGARVMRWKIRTRVITAPEEPVIIDSSKPIEVLLNDPSTPSLIKTVPAPPLLTVPSVCVKGYKGGGFARASEEGQAANVFVSIYDTITYINKQSEKPVTAWPGTATLYVVPKAGNKLNAFYNRSSLQFFATTHAKLGGFLDTADSTDIVTHELGHAILDSFRPDMWNAMSLEVASFHEAWADLTAMLHIMQYTEVLEFAINETNGDLRKSNVISRLAEQFGKAIGNLSGEPMDCLRNAINNFKYVNPAELPPEAPRNQLAAECHSFGQIFLAAFYDILCMVYEDKRTSLSPLEALQAARDVISKYALKAIQNAPLTTKFFQSMATTMLWADVTLSNRQYHDRMQQVFFERKILEPQVGVLSVLSVPNEQPVNGVVRRDRLTCVKLSEVMLMAQSNNPLVNVEIEVPTSEAYLYDNDQQLYNYIGVEYEDSLGAAQDMLNYLNVTNSVSPDAATPFEIIDGKLVRTHFSEAPCLADVR